MMNTVSFILMFAVMIWNFYGIFQVGIENASMLQWILAGLMTVFVIRGAYQRLQSE